MVSSELPQRQPADPFERTPYRAVRLLGAGSMGEVFVVQHREIGKLFVAKVLQAWLTGNRRARERMRIEAQGLGLLRHQHIVRILGFDQLADGRPYILMELLTGRTLRDELVERGPLPVLEAVAFTCQLLSALGAAHAVGIVHRDIKPSNLFLCDSRNSDQRILKVLDFGVARVTAASPVEPLPEELLTRTGQVVGSLPFQSPEGARGEHVDARADLYAVALVLYVMLAGRGPFDHVDDSMILLAHSQETPEPPSRYTTTPVPVELERVILRALSKDPNERFQSAEEFRAALADIGGALGQPAGWLETTAYAVDDSQPDGGSAFVAAGSPSSAVGAHSPPGLSRAAHAALFVAAAALTAGIATALLFALRGAP